jgi:hypothetical protein
MAIGQTELDALEKALANGELTVEYDGFRKTYKSTDEILKAITYVRGTLAPRTTQTYAKFNRA